MQISLQQENTEIRKSKYLLLISHIAILKLDSVSDITKFIIVY